ncbi:MAG TPA: PKD domain-containing protein [Bacteroidia bacterium]|nr:PKD domain-containing protein [Bacteroidia bacterium]
MKKFFFSLATLFVAFNAYAQCQADFGYTNNLNTFTFSDSSTTSSGSIATWFWQFGDNSAPATQQNPQHTYDACGYYEVSLTIFTTSFCSSTYSDTVFVAQGTMPSFTVTVDTTTGDADFQGQPFSTNLVYTWDFGDSTTGTGVNATHTYDSSGTYVACLTVSDTGGYCTYTVCDTVIVYIAPPSCNVTWTNMSLIAGQQTFTAQPFDINWTYTWDFGDASGPGNGFITTHTYASAGTYTVCLTVVDSTNNCTAQFCDTVNIVFTTVCPVTFTNIYLAGNMAFTPTPLSPLNTYTWDFGDATAPGTGLIVNHTYAAPGTYTVCVTMTTFDGCTDTFCDTVIVPSSIGYEEYSSGISALQAMPNPASDQVVLEYSLTTVGDVTIEFTDLGGRIVFSETKTVNQSGQQREEFNLSELAAGSYMIRITMETGAAYVALVKE